MKFTVVFIYILISIHCSDCKMFCNIEPDSVFCNKTSIDEINNIIQHIKLNVKKLVITNSDVKHFTHRALSGFYNLLELKLSNDNITNIDYNVFNETTNLEDINLEYNKIITLPNDLLVNITNLTSINLSNNRIKWFSYKLFHNLNNLENITLSYNNIQRINSFTFNILSLKYLDLSFNAISVVKPEVFGYGESNLIELNLSNNKITSLSDKSFKNLINLNVLNLSFNFISNIVFVSDVYSLNVINLSHNEISAVENEFDALSNLTNLNLDSNNIKLFNLNLLNELQNIKVVSLVENPLSCEWITENMENLTERISLTKFVITKYPSKEKEEGFECFDKENIRNIILISEMSESSSTYEEIEDFSNGNKSMKMIMENNVENEFDFYEIYFWLTLGVGGVILMTCYCIRCMKDTKEEKLRSQKIRIKQQQHALLTATASPGANKPFKFDIAKPKIENV